MSELREQIEKVIQNEDVALFMKGTPQFVMCGNSARALEALRRAGAPVTAVDVLPDPRIRQELSAVSGWPTIPQVFVGGELIGGADIVEELAANGELEQTLEQKLGSGYRDAPNENVVALVLGGFGGKQVCAAGAPPRTPTTSGFSPNPPTSESRASGPAWRRLLRRSDPARRDVRRRPFRCGRARG